MQPLQENYPIFEANQVLTNAHLNQLFNYLDEQQRLTRANLVGIGIVCGLEITFAAAPAAIHISKGCGITSEGYLVIEPDDIALVSYRSYEPPKDIDYPAFKFNDNGTIKPYPLWELFPAGEPNTTPLENPGGFLDDKAVVLFLELKKAGLRNCSPNSCDDKGAAITVTVRRLLIKQNDLNSNAALKLASVPLPRIYFLTPGDLSDYEKVYRDFFIHDLNGKTLVQRLVEAIGQAYQVLNALIPNLDDSWLSQLAAHFSFPDDSAVVSIQYHYDLLRDLTAAYHELLSALSQQTAICLPDSRLFSRHLLLGLANNTAAKGYKSVFIPSPAVEKIGTLRFLFERLKQMVQNFAIPSAAAIPVKITPSLWGLRYLSGKALPFYYSYTLRQQWDAARKGDNSEEILSWHQDAGSPDYISNPLQYDLEPYNFFRIEGHVGKNILDVAVTLGDIIKSRQLPISILYLNADAVGGFLEKHAAIAHEAGVVRGGTFIVLYRGTGSQANLVLADFALPYRIEKTGSSGCICRTAVKECEYEWFDSRQHLSNLARRDYGVSKEAMKSLLSANYVVVIYRYEIQGQALIGDSPEQLEIAVGELISEQLSAIAAKLNEKFPNGLVFDHNPLTDKLVIRYFADQSFRLEWGGLQGNQIRYAYTPDGVYRWQNQDWELLDSKQPACRLRDEYRPDEYKWLHEDSYYEAKYPTPAIMATAKELIDWENMIRKRAATELPKAISDVLREIRHAIDETYNVGGDVVRLVLIGHWANGSWVSLNASENHFPEGFLSLRQKVTGKTGHSDIDLLAFSEDKSITSGEILEMLKDNGVIGGNGYAVNIFFGKKDAQKGKQL